MIKNSRILALGLIFSISSAISCSVSKNSDTENLRKELEQVKKEREDEKLAKQKEDLQKQQGSNTAEAKPTDKPSATPTPTPKPKISAPVGATVAYCTGNNVVVRASPSLQAGKVNSLKRGEKVFVIEESDNYDEWNGNEANWAYIQKETGEKGWVFTPFISYK
jgi:glucan-binding YG repeat protein